MGVAMAWFRGLSDTWKGLAVIAAAVVVGAGAGTTVTNFRGLPSKVADHETRIVKVEDTLMMHTCLQLADRDSSLEWEECLMPGVQDFLTTRQNESSY